MLPLLRRVSFVSSIFLGSLEPCLHAGLVGMVVFGWVSLVVFSSHKTQNTVKDMEVRINPRMY